MLHNIELDQLEQIKSQNPETREVIDQLLENHRMILSTISHEIRNPLALIYSALQLLESTHPEVRDFAFWKDILSDIEFVSSLLNTLSTLNRGYTPQMKVFDLREMLRHLAVTFAISLESESIEFISQIDPSIPEYLGDQVNLQEVILNLLNNAKDSIEGSGKIHLEAVRKDQTIEIRVSDNGCGISPENLEPIFEAFQSFKFGGTGLGLAIARKVVEFHQGEIHVSSTLGVGSVFIITLPMSVVQED